MFFTTIIYNLSINAKIIKLKLFFISKLICQKFSLRDWHLHKSIFTISRFSRFGRNFSPLSLRTRFYLPFTYFYSVCKEISNVVIHTHTHINIQFPPIRNSRLLSSVGECCESASGTSTSLFRQHKAQRSASTSRLRGSNIITSYPPIWILAFGSARNFLGCRFRESRGQDVQFLHFFADPSYRCEMSHGPRGILNFREIECNEKVRRDSELPRLGTL